MKSWWHILSLLLLLAACAGEDGGLRADEGGGLDVSLDASVDPGVGDDAGAVSASELGEVPTEPVDEVGGADGTAPDGLTELEDDPGEIDEDVEIVPLECPNLVNAMDAEVTLTGAGEGGLSACLLRADCHERLVAAHRGFTKEAPENSLAAFEAAWALGVDIIEIDVRETADGALVVIHDPSVDRTTNGSGYVADMSLDAIRALHLRHSISGEWFEDQQVPTFEEVVELARGRLVIDLDMKTERADLVAAAIGALDAHDVVMPRGSLAKLEALVALDPGIRVMPDLNDMDELESLDHRFDLFIVEAHVKGLTAADVSALHEAGLKVWHNSLNAADFAAVLTCNPSTWNKIVDLGVDVIQTDYPQLLGPVFKGVEP